MIVEEKSNIREKNESVVRFGLNQGTLTKVKPIVKLCCTLATELSLSRDLFFEFLDLKNEMC